MWKAALLSLLACPIAWADVYLCAPEASAVIEDRYGQDLKAQTVVLTNVKLVLSKIGGRWQVKRLGEDDPVFPRCYSEYVCDLGENLFGGFFLRSPRTPELFQAVWSNGGTTDRPAMLVSMKGKCTRLPRL